MSLSWERFSWLKTRRFKGWWREFLRSVPVSRALLLTHESQTWTFSKNETWESWSIYILGTILCYIAGAAFTGFLIGHQSFTLSGNLPYDFVLAAEFILLLITSLEEYFESERQAIFPAAVALGLQNALTTSFSGAIVRTTHLTGTSSDIGE